MQMYQGCMGDCFGTDGLMKQGKRGVQHRLSKTAQYSNDMHFVHITALVQGRGCARSTPQPLLPELCLGLWTPSTQCGIKSLHDLVVA